MNTFSEYLARSGETQTHFAGRVGVDQSVISRLARDEMLPGLDLAVRIEAATGGKVRPRDWVAEKTVSK